jgi:hypothetical protein
LHPPRQRQENGLLLFDLRISSQQTSGLVLHCCVECGTGA